MVLFTLESLLHLVRSLQNKKGRSLFIKKPPPFHLKSNIDLDFLSGLYLGYTLVQLELRLDVNF